MGCCPGSIETEDEGHNDIEAQLRSMDQAQERHYKLLLLGAGESGKSTLLSHMKQIHGEPFTDDELLYYKPYILRNVIESMKTLAKYSEVLSIEGHPTQVSKENEELRSKIAMMDEQKDEFGPKECEMFEQLWNDKGIHTTLEFRHRFQILDTAEYLFQHMKRLSQINYIPTFEDLLYSRKRSTGLHHETFIITSGGGGHNNINNNNNHNNNHNHNTISEVLNIYDVGGQRNERSKWVNYFDNCHAIIFVAALSEYNQTLWEDNSQNRMKEALDLFQHVINLEDFKNSHTILFLNKSDIFREKIKKFRLSEYFENFKGNDTNFDETVDFIRQQFSNLRKNRNKLLYVHVTCATDPDNIKNLFQAVRNIVVREQLAQSGFV